jgi:hypothetical protein
LANLPADRGRLLAQLAQRKLLGAARRLKHEHCFVAEDFGRDLAR